MGRARYTLTAQVSVIYGCSEEGLLWGSAASPGASPMMASLAGFLLSWASAHCHCRFPTLMSSQPPAEADSKSVVPATTVVCSGRPQSPAFSGLPGSPKRVEPRQALTGLTTLLFILALWTVLLEVTQLLRGHTQFATGEMSWLTGLLGQLVRYLGILA